MQLYLNSLLNVLKKNVKDRHFPEYANVNWKKINKTELSEMLVLNYEILDNGNIDGGVLVSEDKVGEFDCIERKLYRKRYSILYRNEKCRGYRSRNYTKS